MTVFNTRTENSKDNWSTPQYFFDLLDKEFRFTLDSCASDFNHKCDKYYTIKEDGLRQNWEGETVFCNPPYINIDKWIKKGYIEGRKVKTTVVMLIPCRSDTQYWHKFIMKAKEIRFVKGRISFELNGLKVGSPNFASVVIVFDSWENFPMVSSFYHKEKDLIKYQDIERWLK